MNELNNRHGALGTLFIIRGLAGSGKSTLAKMIAPTCRFEADDFFYDAGYDSGSKYNFDHTKLGEAHAHCEQGVIKAMRNRNPIVAVANTFSTRWEIQKYLDYANDAGYTVQIIECQGSYGSVHDVPRDVIQRMKDRWDKIELVKCGAWNTLRDVYE